MDRKLQSWGDVSGNLCLSEKSGGLGGQDGWGRRLAWAPGSDQKGAGLGKCQGAECGLVQWTCPALPPLREKTPTSLTQVAVPMTGSSSPVTFGLPAACFLRAFTLREEVSSQKGSGTGGQEAPTA